MLESTPEDWIQVLEMCVTLSYMQFKDPRAPVPSGYRHSSGCILGIKDET